MRGERVIPSGPAHGSRIPSLTTALKALAGGSIGSSSQTSMRFAGPLDPKTATVSVIMPVRNEAAHIQGALDSVLAQSFDPKRVEIVVVDGLSDDGTPDLVNRLTKDDGRVRLIQNPARTTAAAMNLGIASSSGDIVVRVDGHCRLAPDYIERCVELLAGSRAGCAGGLMRPRGWGLIGRAAAVAMSSRFGIGDSRFHYLNRREYVDSVYLGAFPREVLEEVGLYDESLLANEDFELNYRIRRAGYGVLLSPGVRSSYMPRESLPSIWRQFYSYGRWKARVMTMHPDSIQPRHLAAPLLVGVLLTGSLGFSATGRRWFLLPLLLYGCLASAAAALTAKPKRLAPVLMAIYPTMHLSWGSGVLMGLLRCLQIPRPRVQT